MKTVSLVLSALTLIGCSEAPDQGTAGSKSMRQQKKSLVLSSICDNTDLFTNSTEQEFVITKIVRENKSYDAYLKVDDEYIWKYKGYQHSKISHTPPRRLVVNPTEAVLCHHHGYQLTVFGYYSPLP